MSNRRDIVKGLQFRKTEGFSSDDVGRVLEEAYLSKRRGSGFKQKYSFAPSALGYNFGRCPRYWYLAFNGAEFVEDTDALGVANMENGSQAHERIEKLFEESGTLIASEVEMKLSDPPVRGYIDLIVKLRGSESGIGEIKTTREDQWLFRKTTMKPSGNHLIQVLLYMKATDKQYGFLLYENKNTNELLVIPVEMNDKNEKIIGDVMDWMREVYTAFKNDQAPQRPFTRRSVICKSCPVQNTCWSDNSPEPTIEIEPMEVVKP